MSTNFEILPNEILLEIFEYLSTVNIFETFYYLNQRYSRLLLSIRLRIDLLNISKEIFDYYNYFLFPIASHCVISLRCEDIFDRFIHHINLLNFISLEYLTIRNINKSTLQYIIPHLNKLSNLIYLNLQTSNQLTTNELYFEESMEFIEKCILNFNTRIIIQGNQCYSNLKYLTINQYHIDDLLSFLHIYTPKLRHLTVTLNNEYNTKKLLRKTVEKHYLQSFIIKQCRIPFNRIEQLILISLPYLKRLNINANGIDYADGRQWERLLSTYFPHLLKFELHTIFPKHDAPTSILRAQLLKTFDITYFISHKWYFAFISHPSVSTIDLFSLPIFDTKIHINLYDTDIEKTIDGINLFDNVNELSLFLTNSNENIKLPNLSFGNVKNLKLISRFHYHETHPRLMIIDISHLVSVLNLESIEFNGNSFPSSTFLLLNYTTKLQSISISFNNLIQMTKTFNDQHICQRLTTLIKHLTITSINALPSLIIFDRLLSIFSQLEFLSLSFGSLQDLYSITMFILRKKTSLLKRMILSIEASVDLNEYMSWLISYMHSHDLEKVDIKNTDNHMSFETSFPDEIILEICRYLHPIDILLSFNGLNSRLNRTINDFIQQIHLSSIISYENYLYLLRIILPSIWSLIQSLTINNSQISCLTTLFLNHIERILPSNLKRLSLFHLNTNEIYQFINRLMNKCQVEELIIQCTDKEFVKKEEYYGYKIAQMLFFHHPSLKSIELRGDILFDLSHLSFLSLSNSIDIIDSTRSSILQRLTIPLRSLSSLHLLLIYQPYLEYLNVHIGDAKTIYDYTITPFPPLLNLHEFHFRSDDLTIKFENISELLTYFPHLKSFSFDLTTECELFFNGNILQTLVYSLDSFQFSIARFSQPTLEEQSLSTFYTSFWLEKKKWFTQSYWHIDEDLSDADYFHIYSIPFSFSNFDVYKCTNENLFSKDKYKSYSKVKRLDLSETSDMNIIPFLQCCPNVQTICLNDIYDDEENYGTDEEEDITDQIEENKNFHLEDFQLSLNKLFHMRYLILHALPDHDLGFVERLVRVTPNLHRLSIYFDDLLEIISSPQHNLSQLFEKHIDQLEIHLDYSWLLADIRRDIPKILRLFSKIKSLTISYHSSQRRLFHTTKELLIHLFKYPTNLLCINLNSSSSIDFQSILKHREIQLMETWLNTSFHIELNSSSIVIWL